MHQHIFSFHKLAGNVTSNPTNLLGGSKNLWIRGLLLSGQAAGGRAFLANHPIKSAGDAIFELKLPLQYFQSHILSKGWWENNAVYEYVYYSEAMLEYLSGYAHIFLAKGTWVRPGCCWSLLSIVINRPSLGFCMECSSIRVRPRFFDQVGHQTTNASIGNKYFFTKSDLPKLWTELTKIWHIFRI